MDRCLGHIRRDQGGFTLIEIIVTVAVSAIIIGMALPQFSKIVKSNRLTSTVNDFVHSLNITRSEAMKTSRASICVSSNQSSCTSGEWDQGWIVFTDINGDCIVDNTERVIYARDGLEKKFAIANEQGDNCVTYSGEGFLFPAGSRATFTFCEPTADIAGKVISVIRSGRPATGTYTGCPAA